jgi:hypothetical protein
MLSLSKHEGRTVLSTSLSTPHRYSLSAGATDSAGGQGAQQGGGGTPPFIKTSLKRWCRLAPRGQILLFAGIAGAAGFRRAAG